MTSSEPGPHLAEAMAAHLRQQFPAADVEVLDESWQHEGHPGANGTGFGTHFRVRISGPEFADLRRVAQHRLVYDALDHFIAHQGVHALAIEAGG